jgi:hypothetical protein
MFANLASLVKATPAPAKQPMPRTPATVVKPSSNSVQKAATSDGSIATASKHDGCATDSDRVAAAAVDVRPVWEVQLELRKLGEPITLFGESGADREARLVSVLQRNAGDVVAEAASASLGGPSETNGGATSGAVDEQATFELRCRDAQTQVQTIYESTRTKHAGGVPVWLSAENLETKEGDVIEAAHAFAGAQINLILARWRLRLGGFGVDTRHASPPLREWLRCAADIEPLRVVIEERCCPFTMLKVITSIFIELDRGEILEAENHYFSLAIGSDPWRIGVYSGTMHERAKAMSLHRGTVKHVMNNDVVRRCMLAVKMLITEAGRSK